MKITKYLHSCLLVEQEEKTILLDLGVYTFQANILPPIKLKTLDYIGITHEHQDHFDMAYVKELVSAFPQVKIFTNASVKQHLQKEHIDAEVAGEQIVSLTDLPHEKLFSSFPPVAPNVGITVANMLLHVGDSLQFTQSPNILALPVQAPWASMVACAEAGEKAKPKHIIPIHDYHWKDEFRQQFYHWLADYFTRSGIIFHPIQNEETIEI